MHFGPSLRLLRTERGLSLRELGGAIGVSTAYLSRVEHGHDAPPTADRLRAIASVLGVPVDLLLDLGGRLGPAVDLADTSPVHRRLLAELARRRLGPAQVARILDFVVREFPVAPWAAGTPGLAALLPEDRILLRVQVGTVDDAIELAAMRLAAPDQVAALAAVLRDRERLVSSALGCGLLLPHSRGFSPAPSACLVLLDRPVPAPTPDGAPLRAVLALVGLSEGASGLSTLARAARLAETDIVDRLCLARTPAEACAQLALADGG
jgi:PTS system nitrogen regulatory IIA component